MQDTHYSLSGPQLFKEIQARGYRGSASTLRNFLSAIRRIEYPSEAYFNFHQNYLEEKLQGEGQPRHASTLELFKDIQSRGYRGSIDCVRKKLTVMRREIALKKNQAEGYLGSIKAVQTFLTMRAPHSPETRLSFHKNDLIKKIKEMPPHQITAAQLFRDIQAKGYRGSIKSVQQLVAIIRKNSRLSESVPNPS